jgi:protein ImuB
MLWACLFLPKLPLEVFAQAQTNTMPFAIEEQRKNQRFVLWANHTATEQGIENGMTIPTAQSLVEKLNVRPRHLPLECKALHDMGIWAHQFTPHISLKPPACILLEIESCLRLFGGLESFDQRLRQQLDPCYYTYHLSYGSTPLAAHALSQAGISHNIIDNELDDSDLHDVAIPCLTLEGKHREHLQGMGLRTLGDLLQLPKDELGQRFGKGLLSYLDKVIGQQADPQPPFHIPQHFHNDVPFTCEISNTQMLLFPLKRLLQNLGNYLISTQKAVKQFTLLLHHHDKTSTPLVIQMSQSAFKWQDFMTVTQLHLERTTLAQPVLSMSLQATQFLPLQVLHKDLLGKSIDMDSESHQLIDRLRARLGPKAVTGIALKQEHRPEKAWEFIHPGKQQAEYKTLKRPLWLLNRPKLLRVKEQQPFFHGLLDLMQGPERIETGWWDDTPVNRDYYIAKHVRGDTYWIYQDRDNTRKWYLHGIFS